MNLNTEFQKSITPIPTASIYNQFMLTVELFLPNIILETCIIHLVRTIKIYFIKYFFFIYLIIKYLHS